MKLFLSKKKKNLNNNTNEYWIYGKHAAVSALQNKKRIIKKIFISENKYTKYQKIIKNNLQFNYSKLKLIKVKDEKISKLFNKNVNHQGIAVKVRVLKIYDFNDFLHDISKKSENKISILPYKISDPHNLGAILRSAAAFKICNVLLTKSHSSKENSTVTKVSSGGIEVIKFYNISNLSSSLKSLKTKGIFIIGLDGFAEISLKELKSWNLKSKNILIVLGSEEKGLNQIIKKYCDIVCKIDIDNITVESLNVSCASAIAFYEISSYV